MTKPTSMDTGQGHADHQIDLTVVCDTCRWVLPEAQIRRVQAAMIAQLMAARKARSPEQWKRWDPDR